MTFRGKNLRMMVMAGAAAFAGVAAGCADPDGGPGVATDLAELDADGVSYGMTTYITVDGIRDSRVRADTAYTFQDSAAIHMWGVEMNLYRESGAARARLTARWGRLNQQTDEMVARGDVVLRMIDQGVVIESPELHYDPASDRIWSDSTTTRREGGRETRGSCFRSDLQFRNFTVCDPRGAADLGPGTEPVSGEVARPSADTLPPAPPPDTTTPAEPDTTGGGGRS